ncbi:MAG TPA: glycoside hydrolase family 3 C-terminal domain-containing protein [Pyrinomonadaceae bacterium]|nr:glycoside hydrolase family 3 C-terminal domain-containing protein [Pyrinomonadaceae bacterium]
MRRLCSIVALSLIVSTVLSASAQAPALSTRSSAEVERRVDSILNSMTLEEKLDLLGGVDGFFIRDVPRLNLPRLKMADGPVGVRNFGPATAFAGGVTLTATWNPALAELVGTELGRDCRAKGVHFLLAPGVNINRAPMNGRNFEYFGEDPFLASRIAVGYIKGVQSQGVSATIKHFIANNSEFDRHNTDSVIDERAMREIYLPAFEAAVKEARVGAIMDSYNLTNGQHMSQNKYLLSEVVKKEWGFDGLIMSDWSGTYDGVEAANAGQDLEMPSGLHMNQETLKPAIEQGKVSVATIDDKVRRILRTAVRFGWLDRDQTGLSIPRFNPQGRQVALKAAREGITLLKNESGLLPLSKSKIKSILIIGPDAFPAVPVGGGSAEVQPFAAISYLEGLSNYPGAAFQVYYDRGVLSYSDLANATNFTTSLTNGEPGLKAEYFDNEDLKGTPSIARTEQHVDFGTAARLLFPEQTLSSRWTGYYTPQDSGFYDLFVQTTREVGGSYRLYVDDKLVLDNWTTLTALADYRTLRLEPRAHKIVLEQHGRAFRRAARLRMGVVRAGKFVSDNAKKLAGSADVVVVAAGFDAESEAESADRTFRLPLGQDELIKEMAAANKNTIVVMTSGGSVDMNAWLAQVPALVQAWYPGQEGGTALAEILFGDVNPSGRLPVTFERRWEDNPVHDSYYPQAGTKRVVYKEGVFVGYRGYEHNRTKPLFPFGFGLSFTTFEYSNLSIKPLSQIESGPHYEVSFDVKNTGKREGAEVAQVYVGDTQTRVPRPAKELKGFLKVNLRAGETRGVSVMLDGRALSYYDVKAKQWRAEPGDFNVLVGRSSEQIELRGKLTLTASVGR